MFTITNKIRTIVAISAVGAVLGSTGVASAAMLVQKPGTVTTVVAPPTTVYLDPSKVGSANDNYTDQQCEDLANGVNNAMNGAHHASAEGDSFAATEFTTVAEEKLTELQNNCFVID